MKTERIPVVDQNHKPLMPTTPRRARKWIESGKAIKKWSDCGQFYVQLTFTPSGYNIQDIVIGVDPGKLYSGIGVQSAKYSLYSAHLILPFETVKRRMGNRKLMRRSRRGRRINKNLPFSKRSHRQKRFNNRKKSKLSPSIKANRQLELKVVFELSKIYPISNIRYEYLKVDVDITSNRKRVRSGKSFSPVMVGQKWMLVQLQSYAPVHTIEGYETALIRSQLNLIKDKLNKSTVGFQTHAVDGIAIAASHFVKYCRYCKSNEEGFYWKGSINITKPPFYVIQRPPYSRRQLHLMNPSKKGIRRKYGGSLTPFKIRKGDLIKYKNKNLFGFCSGYTSNSICLSNFEWVRLGKFSSKKVELVKRNKGLMSKKIN